MRRYDFPLSNGQIATFNYNPHATDPRRCITEYSGHLDFEIWPEVLDGLLGIYDHHARLTGRAFDVKWKLGSSRVLAFSISPHRKAEPLGPHDVTPFSPDKIRAEIAARITPERIAELIGKMPKDRQGAIVRTSLVPPPVKRQQNIKMTRTRQK